MEYPEPNNIAANYGTDTHKAVVCPYGADEMKKCYGCNKDLPKTEFHKHPHTSDRLGSRCKKCDSDTKRKKRQDQKRQAIIALGGKCCVCGYDRCQDALDFHHKDPSKKEFALERAKRMKFEIFMAEVEKCILVCATCHREIHAGLHGDIA